MKILVACEFSGVVSGAFRRLGHEVWSCDLIERTGDKWHYAGDVREMLCYKWDLIIAHPPCTYLSKARGKIHCEGMYDAINFFRLFLAVDCPKVAIENPMPFRKVYERLPRPNHWYCPSHFGYPYSKFTCLWLKGLPPLMPTVYFPRSQVKSITNVARSSKSRSITPGLVAEAMAAQWG